VCLSNGVPLLPAPSQLERASNHVLFSAWVAQGQQTNPQVAIMSVEKGAILRLQKELKALTKEPVPNITARPSPSSILDWHYVLEGAKDSPYEGGVYHGKITFPKEYPFKPPSISMITPNGRFQVNTRLCLSMSDFHPESWNPMWSVASILTGLMSFMVDEQPTTGSMVTSKSVKKALARDSIKYNLNNSLFRKVFPDLLEDLQERQRQREEESGKQH